MTICRAGRGGGLAPDLACDREATRPSLRGGQLLRWCDEHEAALRRVAVATGNLPPELDVVIASIVAAADAPMSKANLAIAADISPARRVFVQALEAAVAAGKLVEGKAGNATTYARPDVVIPEPPAATRRPRSEQAAQLARAVAQRGKLTREEAADELGIALTSVGHILASGRGHGWLETHGRRDPFIWPGPTAAPEAVAA